jgi:hypothetical protein
MLRVMQHVAAKVAWRCFEARLPHAPQVLHSVSNDGMGETSGMDACDDDKRSQRVVIMTLA